MKKRRQFQKILVLVLSFVMLLTGTAENVTLAAAGEKRSSERYVVDDVIYECDASTRECVLAGHAADIAGVVKIPDSIVIDEMKYMVTGIEGYAFWNCTALTDIIIPESVTSIGDSAFSGCEKITVYCAEGSIAQTYASVNGLDFYVYPAGGYAIEVQASAIEPVSNSVPTDAVMKINGEIDDTADLWNEGGTRVRLSTELKTAIAGFNQPMLEVRELPGDAQITIWDFTWQMNGMTLGAGESSQITADLSGGNEFSIEVPYGNTAVIWIYDGQPANIEPTNAPVKTLPLSEEEGYTAWMRYCDNNWGWANNDNLEANVGSAVKIVDNGTYTLELKKSDFAEIPESTAEGAMVWAIEMVGMADAQNFDTSDLNIRDVVIKVDGRKISTDSSKMYFGNIEDSNDVLRLEICNEWGYGNGDFKTRDVDENDDPIAAGFDLSRVRFNESLSVTFTLEGIREGSTPEGAWVDADDGSVVRTGTGFVAGDPDRMPLPEEEGYTACMLYTDNNWSWVNWNPGENGREAVITGNGTYTVSLHRKDFAEMPEDAADGAMVWVVDLIGMANAQNFDTSKLTIRDVTIRVDGRKIWTDSSKMYYGDIERKGDIRLEICNEWGYGSTYGDFRTRDIDENGDPIAAGFDLSKVKFEDSVSVTFTLEGIREGSTPEGAWMNAEEEPVVKTAVGTVQGDPDQMPSPTPTRRPHVPEWPHVSYSPAYPRPSDDLDLRDDDFMEDLAVEGLDIAVGNTVKKGFLTVPQVELFWDANDRCDGYEIWRSNGGKNFRRVDIIDDEEETEWYDTTVKKGRRYSYQVLGYIDGEDGEVLRAEDENYVSATIRRTVKSCRYTAKRTRNKLTLIFNKAEGTSCQIRVKYGRGKNWKKVTCRLNRKIVCKVSPKKLKLRVRTGERVGRRMKYSRWTKAKMVW